MDLLYCGYPSGANLAYLTDDTVPLRATIESDMNEQDALDIMTTVSLIHRKVDNVYPYTPLTT